MLADFEVQGLQLCILGGGDLDQTGGFVEGRAADTKAFLVLAEIVGGNENEGCARVHDT